MQGVVKGVSNHACVGEVFGGSTREERLEAQSGFIDRRKVPQELIRRYGYVLLREDTKGLVAEWKAQGCLLARRDRIEPDVVEQHGTATGRVHVIRADSEYNMDVGEIGCATQRIQPDRHRGPRRRNREECRVAAADTDLDSRTVRGSHIEYDLGDTAKVIPPASLEDSPVLRLFNIHTDKFPRCLGIKGDPHHRPVHAVQYIRIRRAPIGHIGVVNAAGVDVNRAEIAWAPEEARGETMMEARVLVQVDIKTDLVGGDALI